MYRKRLISYFGISAVMLLLLSFILTSASEATFFGLIEGKNDVQPPAAIKPADGYQKAAENNWLSLYVNPSTLGIRVVNKKTGKLWSSSLEEKDENMNQLWLYFFQSGITVEYMDDTQKIRQATIVGDKAEVALHPAENGFAADVAFQELGFRLSLQVTLKEDRLIYTVPYDSIEEKDPKRQLQAIYVFPFFGASKGLQKDGSIFIPDGSGALIDLGTPTIAKQPYIAKVYGEDRGMKGVNLAQGDQLSLVRKPEHVYLPVFGTSDGATKNGLVTMLGDGAPYAEIHAYPGGVTTPYNWVTAKWIYRETYLKPLDKKGNGMIVNQKSKNRFDASAKVMFLGGEGSDYVGMAKRVRQELVQDGVLVKKEENKAGLPVHLEIFAADSKRELLWRKVVPMTTTKELDAILTDLHNSGVQELSVAITGWTEGGYTDSFPTLFSWEKALGSESDWRSLIHKYESMGIPLRFVVDYSMGQNGKGYGERDIIQAITEQLLVYWDHSADLRPEATKRLFTREMPIMKQNGINHLAVTSIGDQLTSSFGNPVTPRDKAREIYQSIFAENGEMRYSFYAPNDYLWKYADQILAIPMDSSNYLVETESVPFLQIVLKGYVDYYAPESNFEADPRKGLLKRIDYGALPSFLLTEKDPIELIDTGSSWIYTSQYKVWKEEILHEYEQVRKALLPVKGAAFTDRNMVSEGVIENKYSNGVTIWINYTKKDYTVGSKTVPAESFLVIGR